MSLLDTGTDTITVFPEETYQDSYGNTQRRPSQSGVVVVGCRMQPMASMRLFPSNDATQQQTIYATWRLIARDAPLGVWSRVEWQGKTLSVRSGPERRRYSSTTSHITALLQEER